MSAIDRRAALYARVSTGEQTCANQLPDLQQLARTRGLQVVSVYEEQASAAKRRPEFERVMTDAHRGRFDVLIVWSLDRFGRSMVGNLTDVLALDRAGVQVVSALEPWLVMQGPVRPLLVASFSWVAEQERLRLIERTKAGLERTRRQGTKLGRPRVFVPVGKAEALMRQGSSMRAAARALGVSFATLHRALKGSADPKTSWPAASEPAEITAGAQG